MEVDGDVNDVVSTIRAQFAPQLAALKTAAQTTALSSLTAFDDALAHHARAASKGTIDMTTAWTRMLSTVFRRYARHLVVRGKLLNQEELLVSQFARLNTSGSLDTSVCIPSALGLRFIVHCVDGPVERVGCDDVVARIETDYSTSSNSYSELIAVIVSADSDDVDTKRLVSPSQWDQPHSLTALKTLYGFDVRSLGAPHAASSASVCISQMADARDDCANAVLMRTNIFQDLRATQLLQQQHRGAAHLTSPSPLLQSFIMASTCNVTADHPQSYVSLGQAQKRAWATERFRLGQHLVAQARVKDAIAEFTSCLQLDDTYADALYARSDAYMTLQQFRDAVRDLETLRTLDAAFPGLDAALARAQSKLRHAQRVDVVASAVSTHRGPAAAAVANVEQSLPRDSRPQKPMDKTTRSRSRSPARQTLERDRLRTLLEAEVAATRRKQTSGRDASDGERSDSSSSSSEDEESRRRHRKSKHKKSKHKHKKHKKKHKTTKKRRRHGTRSENSESESERSRRKHRRSSSRHRSRRSRSDSDADAASSRRRRHARSRSLSRSPSSRQRQYELQEQSHTDAPHPILARERHRIWN